MNLNDISLPQAGDENNYTKKLYLGHGVRTKVTISLYEFTCGHESCSKINRVNMYDMKDHSVEEIDKEAESISKFELIDGMYFCSYCAPFHRKN